MQTSLRQIAAAVQMYGKSVREDGIGQVSFVVTPPSFTDLPGLEGAWKVAVRLVVQAGISGSIEEGTFDIALDKTWEGQGASEEEARADLHKTVESFFKGTAYKLKTEWDAVQAALHTLNVSSLSELWATSDPSSMLDNGVEG